MSPDKRLIRQRIRRMERALFLHGPGTPYANLIEILGDALHWCKHTDWDFTSALYLASKEFLEERGEHPDQRREEP